MAAVCTCSLISFKRHTHYTTWIPFSLSSFVMSLKMCFSSCTRMPVRPTYEGHFDLTTKRQRNESENMRILYMLKISPLHWNSGNTAAEPQNVCLCGLTFPNVHDGVPVKIAPWKSAFKSFCWITCGLLY